LPSFLRRLLGRPGPALADIDEALWRESLAAMPWLRHLDAGARQRLRERVAGFLAAKTITGAAGFEIDDRVRIAIAIQACLPILNLGLQAYDDFVEIIVYPDRFLVPRSQVDDAGVVHESTDELAGEAMEHGPVVLSWHDAAPDGERNWNVVIHEFAHKIDMLDGEPDGVPPLPPSRRAAWAAEIDRAWQAFCSELDRLEARIPPHVDPESAEGEAWYASLPLDPYAATDIGEFFAVLVESFFVDPEPVQTAFPELYDLLADYFDQNPLARGLGGADDTSGASG
jgi:Mlc titration factor MtfA (ptsG expression regulator)